MRKSSEDSGKPAASGDEPAEHDPDLPRATVVGPARPSAAPAARPDDAFPRWVWPAGAGALLALGWIFILAHNNFHLTTPVAIVCLGYAAGVAAVYTLFRTGSAVASAGEGDGDDDDASWGRPLGVRAELEREKKALLKAIKEAEFDLHMGKLSGADAEGMIGTYRAQAIAIIREIDRKEGAESASAREQIAREVRARLEVGKAKKAADADRRPQGKKGKKQAPAKAEAEKAAEAAAKAEEAEEAKAEAAAAAKAEEAEAAKTEEAEEAAAKADEVTDAAEDAVMPDPGGADARGAGAGKEATP